MGLVLVFLFPPSAPASWITMWNGPWTKDSLLGCSCATELKILSEQAILTLTSEEVVIRHLTEAVGLAALFPVCACFSLTANSVLKKTGSTGCVI